MKQFLIGATLLFASSASAQNANDPSARLRQVLPADVAQHVLATIADARSHSLPAAALEQQALKLARNGTKPADVEKSIDRSAENMKKSKAALEKAGRKPFRDIKTMKEDAPGVERASEEIKARYSRLFGV